MRILSRQLKLSGSTLAFIAATAVVPALAQSARPGEAPVESVTVTGTSIRGVAPVGANVITVGPLEMQKQGGQTLDDILKQVPSGRSVRASITALISLPTSTSWEAALPARPWW